MVAAEVEKEAVAAADAHPAQLCHVADKEPWFDSVDTLEAILAVLPPMLMSLTFRPERMRRAAGEHYATATDLADYLVKKGVPFR